MSVVDFGGGYFALELNVESSARSYCALFVACVLQNISHIFHFAGFLSDAAFQFLSIEWVVCRGDGQARFLFGVGKICSTPMIHSRSRVCLVDAKVVDAADLAFGALQDHVVDF